MASRRLGGKLLSETLMVYFIDAYMRHLASMSERIAELQGHKLIMFHREIWQYMSIIHTA